MANIRVDVGYTIHDGTEIKFRSPVDCSAITGMIVYYPGADGSTISKVFALADAHGNNVGDIDHLFAEDVVVKVILDVTKGMAFVQNADTNTYLEERLASKAPAGYGFGEPVETCEVGSKEELVAFLEQMFQKCPMGGAKKVCFYVLADFWGMRTNYCFIGNVYKYGSITGGFVGHNYYPNFGEVSIDRYNTWKSLEWSNPPLVPGVEYRTTERHDGNPVYVQAFNIGTLTQTEKEVVTKIANLDVCVDVGGVARSTNGDGRTSYSLPCIMKDKNIYLSAMRWVNSDYTTDIYIYQSADMDVSNLTATAWVKYTKTTD